MKKLSEMTSAERAARVAQLVKNPATRSAVPTKYLPTQYRKARDLNTSLAQPIVPGSSTTRRDLAHQREAGVTLQYGANAEGKQEQANRDSAGWYDQYVQELAQHRANVAAAGQQAQDQLAGIGNATRGLDQASLSSQLQASKADAASRGADVGSDVAKNGADASAARQAMLGSFQAVQNAQGTNATNYADALAHLVAPGQRLQAAAQGQGKLADLRSSMGAFRTKFEGDAKSDEAKTMLASQSLGLDVAKETADQSKDSYLRDNHLGVYAPPAKPKAPDTGKVNQYGYSDKDWRAMATADRQKVIKDFKASSAKPVDPATQYEKDFFAKYGIKPAATAAVSRGRKQIVSAKGWVSKIHSSNPEMTYAQLRDLLLRGQAKGKGSDEPAIPKQDPLWLTVALDQAFRKGKISDATANALHHNGYSVKQLGL